MAVKKRNTIDPVEVAHDYHVASAVFGWTKEMPSLFQSNYETFVVELVQEGGVRVESGSRISLPVNAVRADMPLYEAIEKRQSGRQWADSPLGIEHLGRILYLSNGIRNPEVSRQGSGRNVPNAGGLGSVETFVVVLNVKTVPAGIYHFDSTSHDLALIAAGDYRKWVELNVCIQEEFSEASAILILASSQGRLSRKYGVRAYRLGLLDAGHVSQNIYLSATALGLEVCATAGFIDDEVNAALKLDGIDDCAILALGIGKKK